MRVVLTIIVSFVSLYTYGQSNSPIAFLQQKRTIDSLSKLIESNQEFIEMRTVGHDSIYGDYNGSCLYNDKDKLVYKIECTFLAGSSGVKVCYFQGDSLIKLIDRGTVLYYLNPALVNESGGDENTREAMKLLFFQNRTRKNLKSLIRY
jgi:hypothetical protein